MTEHPDSILRVEYRSDKPVAVLTFDAPPLNIITIPTREQFGAVFREIEANDAVRVIIVRGAGEHFSSGGDVVGFLKVTPEYISHFAENVAAPERCSKPVIACLSGYALGVGLEIGTQRIARMAGLGRAMDMILRARRIAAEEAKSWGLLTEVVSMDELDARVDALVDELLVFSPLAYRLGKQALHASMEVPLSAGLALEGRMYGFLRTTEDFREGVQAFKEKRRPHFQGK